MKKRITDKDRLDWFGKNLRNAFYDCAEWTLSGGRNKNIRQAIDAAIRAERNK